MDNDIIDILTRDGAFSRYGNSYPMRDMAHNIMKKFSNDQNATYKLQLDEMGSRISNKGMHDIKIELVEAYQKWNLLLKELKSGKIDPYYPNEQKEIFAVIACDTWHAALQRFSTLREENEKQVKKQTEEQSKVEKRFRSSNKYREWIVASVAVLAFIFGGNGIYQLACNKICDVSDLKRIQHLNAINKSTYDKLKENFFVYDSSVQKTLDTYESYRYRRRNGEEANLMKAHIESLMANNDSIQRILKNHTNFKVKGFEMAADSFMRHAEETLIRYRAIDKMLFTNEKLPTALPFPQTFPTLLKEEIAECK